MNVSTYFSLIPNGTRSSVLNARFGRQLRCIFYVVHQLILCDEQFLFMVYLTTMSTQSVLGWMIGWSMKKELERMWNTRSCPDLWYYLGICLKGLRKTRDTSVKIAGLQDQIWTQDFRLRSRNAHKSTVTFGEPFYKSWWISMCISYKVGLYLSGTKQS
jgi:hypothetical protein